MNQIKNYIQKDFTVIPNSLIEDNEISDRARFLFVYLACKPDNWNFNNYNLSKSLRYSEDTLRKYMQELENRGWIKRILKRRYLGKFTFNVYVIHGSRQPKQEEKKLPYRKKQNPKNTVSENFRHGKTPTHNNTKYKQKTTNNKTYPNSKNSKKNQFNRGKQIV